MSQSQPNNYVALNNEPRQRTASQRLINTFEPLGKYGSDPERRYWIWAVIVMTTLVLKLGCYAAAGKHCDPLPGTPVVYEHTFTNQWSVLKTLAPSQLLSIPAVFLVGCCIDHRGRYSKNHIVHGWVWIYALNQFALSFLPDLMFCTWCIQPTPLLNIWAITVLQPLMFTGDLISWYIQVQRLKSVGQHHFATACATLMVLMVPSNCVWMYALTKFNFGIDIVDTPIGNAACYISAILDMCFGCVVAAGMLQAARDAVVEVEAGYLDQATKSQSLRAVKKVKNVACLSLLTGALAACTIVFYPLGPTIPMYLFQNTLLTAMWFADAYLTLYLSGLLEEPMERELGKQKTMLSAVGDLKR